MTSKLSEAEERYYEELAQKAERGELRPTGKQLHGRAAAEASQKLIMEATETQTIEDATRVALGRPRLAEEEDRQPNVPWKLVAPAKLDAEVEEARKPRGLNRSQYIRRAVTNQLRVDRGEPRANAEQAHEALVAAIARADKSIAAELVDVETGGKMTAQERPRILAEALLADESLAIAVEPARS